MNIFFTQRELFYRKSTIGTIIAAIEANKDMYCLQKRIEKFLLNTIKILRKGNCTKLKQLNLMQCFVPNNNKVTNYFVTKM